jgi:plasmid stabilization system protein ParE
VPRRLGYTDDALADLDAMRRWLTQPGSGPAARRRMTAIWAAIERLRQHPCLHARGDQPGTREVSSEGHRIIYVVDPDTGRNADAGDVTVLRVFGPGRSRERL